MVIFNDLRMSDCKRKLLIDCAIEDLDVYSGMYINAIYVENYRTASVAAMPSEKSTLVWENTKSDSRVRSVRLEVSTLALDSDTFTGDTFDGELFYVIVQCDGDASAIARVAASLPCGADDTFDVGVILDWEAVYSRGMQYVSMFANKCNSSCDLPIGFEDFIILWNSLRLAISTCDWDLVAKLWPRFLYGGGYGSVGGTKNVCGCRS